MKPQKPFHLLLIVTLFILSCNSSVNRSIRIRNGETVRQSLNSVNGSVIVGSDCVITGNCRSVNGRIEMGSNSEVDELQTVNGRISVESCVSVDGDIESINGSVSCNPGVKVWGTIASINGSIDLDSTEVTKNLVTYNGHITLSNKSVIQRDIIIKDSKSKSDSRRPLKIRVEDRSIVEGDIIVRDEDKRVEVYLSDGGKVNGRIERAEVIR